MTATTGVQPDSTGAGGRGDRAGAGRSGRPGAGARRALATVVALVLLVSGCASIPSDGVVERRDVDVNEPGPVYVQPYGPSPDATPLQIVQGFLSAQAAGSGDDWSTARQFLADRTRASWVPTARTIVFSKEADLQVAEPVEPEDGGDGGTTDDDGTAGDGVPEDGAGPGDASPSSTAPPGLDPDARVVTVTGRVPVTATLDSAGRYTEAASGTVQDLRFTVERGADDQWRITATEDGVFVSDPNFLQAFRSTPLYFPTPDRKYLVPEVRWYPRTKTAAFAVNGLLAGPSEWLRDSVLVVAPEGTRLVLDAVAVEDGTAQVDLTQDVLAASDEDRAMLRAQLEAVLLRIPGIRDVEITAGSAALTIRGEADPERDPVPSTAAPLVLADGYVSTVDGTVVAPVPGLLSLAGKDVTALATDDSLTRVVVRTGTTRISTVPTLAAPEEVLLTGTDLLAPSVDRFGWVWSGESAAGAPLQAVSPAGEVATVTGDLLSGRTVESVRVSRDGVRLAIVSTAGGTSRIDVAAIVRGDGGAPMRLSDPADPVAVGASVQGADQVVWVDESTLGVLAEGQTSGTRTVHIIPLSGHSEALSGVDGSEWLAAGRGRRSIYVLTTDGELLSRTATGASWSFVVGDVALPAFPG